MFHQVVVKRSMQKLTVIYEILFDKIHFGGHEYKIQNFTFNKTNL